MALGSLTIPFEKKKEEPVAPIFSEKDIESWISEGDSVNSEICALYCGDPKTTKTGCAIDSRTEEEIKEGKKIIYIEMNSDSGGRINKKAFKNDDPTIIVIDPREFTVDPTTGDWNFDYIRTMAKTKALLMWIKTNYKKLNIHTVILDGVDIFLSEVCENQMRMDESLDITGGVKMTFWKSRNKYFYDVINMMLSIDINKIFITHFKEDSETKKLTYGCQKNMPDKLHQIVEFRKDPKTGNCYAKVVADRRNKPELLNKEICTMEVVDGKRIWRGLRL